jgi:hypothetical protein
MTMGRPLTRRVLLRRCALLPLASLPLFQACSKNGSSGCTDPALLSRGEEQMRKTLEYVEVASVENQDCGHCQFFSAADEQGCGHCEILDGSVSGRGYCTSWAHQG